MTLPAPETGGHIPDASTIIDRFGGIRPMANKLGMAVTTVQGWKKRGVIPANRVDQIAAAATAHGIDLGPLLRVVEGAVDEPSSSDPDLDALDVSARLDELRAALVDPTMGIKNEPEGEKETSPSAVPPTETSPTTPTTLPLPVQTLPSARVGNRRRRDRYARAVWVASFVLALAALIGLFAMRPGVERIIAQQHRIAEMETQLRDVAGQVTAIRSENTMLQGLVPEDVRGEVSALRDRAQKMESTLSTLGQQTQALATELTTEKGGVESRLKTLEGEWRDQMGATPLADFMVQMQRWAVTAGGQQNLDALNNNLRAALGSLGAEADVTAALQKDPNLAPAFGKMSGPEVRLGASLLSLNGLSRALSSAAPQGLGPDLTALRRMLGDGETELSTAIDRLLPRAGAGKIAGPAVLAHDFDAIANTIVTASLQGGGANLVERAQAQLHNVLRIDRAGVPITGTPTQRAVDQARGYLQQGNVTGAVSALQALTGPAATAAAPFMARARDTAQALAIRDLATRTLSAQLSIQPFVQQYKGGKPGAMDLDQLARGLAQSLSSGSAPGIPPRP